MRFQRDFLVPYLQNVCSMELLREKIDAIESKYSVQVTQKQLIPKPTAPAKPQLKFPPITAYIFMFILSVGILACVLFIALMIFMVDDKGFFSYVLLIAAAIGLLMLIGMAEDPLYDIQSTWRYNKSERRRYKYETETLDNRVHQWKHRMDTIVPIRKKADFWYGELRKAENLLDELYSVNIIPGQYRNKYAALYLYQYFSESQFDDLAMALNTFVLEEIKEKLDKIIRNQSEILINQRLQIAMQRESNELQKKHTKMMKAKLDNMQTTLEEHNSYLRMIESDTATTAFLTKVNYIRNI